MDEQAILRRLAEGPVSGDGLARAAGVTRAAVWKRIEGLREAGVAIEAAPGQGYRLVIPLDLLDADALRAAVPAPVAAGIARLDVAWSIDSTNSELLRRGAPSRGVDVLLAERQTGGRGRRGRPWQSPLGANLYLSVSRAFEGGLARLGGLSLVAGLAAAEALHALGYPQVALKWPNDLVVADGGGLRKLGGLLVEGGGEHGGPANAVIGLGLNVAMPARAGARIDQPWIDLAALGGAPPRTQLAAALVAHLVRALDLFDRDGFAPFAERWQALDALRGRDADLHLPGGIERVHVLGLGVGGALRVRGADGRERDVHAGEVSLRGRVA
jgi:BirA family biotin operon repressor/biotin-[acetyl-CoA-carboxylase] ligase